MEPFYVDEPRPKPAPPIEGQLSLALDDSPEITTAESVSKAAGNDARH